ncbi:MAG: hypothetical protein HS116_05215 [Planctomycetes bacterium]|nr:hypothetical protein [Planctomycetota bacterium]
MIHRGAANELPDELRDLAEEHPAEAERAAREYLARRRAATPMPAGLPVAAARAHGQPVRREDPVDSYLENLHGGAGECEPEPETTETPAQKPDAYQLLMLAGAVAMVVFFGLTVLLRGLA